MNDRTRPATIEPESNNVVAVLQWRVAVLESDLGKQESENKATTEKLEAQIKALADKQDASTKTLDKLINKGLGIGLAISFLGMLVGWFLSLFKTKLGIG